MSSKQREALTKVSDVLETWCDHLPPIIQDEAKEALDEPLRNCDIGTVEEQAERFLKFCKRNQSPIQGMCSSSCPCKHQPDMCHCYAKWAQMPYKESEAKKCN